MSMSLVYERTHQHLAFLSEDAMLTTEEEVLMTHDHDQLITELGMAAYRNQVDVAQQHYITLIRTHQRTPQELLHIVRNAILGRGGSEADYRAFAAELEIALLH